MKYMGDNQWWNKRFKDRDLNVMVHEKCLEEDLGYFPKNGKVLDLACGDGRNSIYLASLGYQVLAIDFSQEALNRLEYFAAQKGLNIEVMLMDLSSIDNFDVLNGFDIIVINHYRLKPHLYMNLMNCLNVDGILLVNGFKAIPHDNPDVKEDDIFSNNDFMCLSDYVLKDDKYYQMDDRLFMRKMWKK